MSGKTSTEILSFHAYTDEDYLSIDLNRLTVFSISELAHRDLPTSIENITVTNFRLFPARFAMHGFPAYPDTARVNRALLQLGPKYRNWAVGRARSGWTLTPAGEAEASAVRSLLKSESKSANIGRPGTVREDATQRTIDTGAEIRRLRATQLFARARAGWSGVDNLEVLDALGAYSHTPRKVLQRRLRELRQLAIDAQDRELVDFLDDIRHRFPALLGRE